MHPFTGAPSRYLPSFFLNFKTFKEPPGKPRKLYFFWAEKPHHFLYFNFPIFSGPQSYILYLIPQAFLKKYFLFFPRCQGLAPTVSNKVFLDCGAAFPGESFQKTTLFIGDANLHIVSLITHKKRLLFLYNIL